MDGTIQSLNGMCQLLP